MNKQTDIEANRQVDINRQIGRMTGKQSETEAQREERQKRESNFNDVFPTNNTS